MGLTSIVKKGSSGYLLEITIRSSSTGQLLSGLTAGNMTIEYQRQGAAGHVTVTPVAGTLGTWASGSWVESVPGIYQFGVPNAALVAGADFVIIVFESDNSLTAVATVYLTASDLQDSADLGLTNLDATVATRATLGAGAVITPLTFKNHTTMNPIDGVDVWITTDEAGANVIARDHTNGFGQVVFMLDAGEYYVWKQLAGFTFTNPEELTVL